MNTDIHRLLDEAFACVEMTPDTQDLKEEIRANLIARVDELEASGVSSTDAARRAVAELGDIHELLDDPSTDASRESSNDGPVVERAPASRNAAGNRYDLEAMGRRRVRPKPGFVVRTVLLSILAAASLTLFGLGIFGLVALGMAGLVATGLVFAVALGIVTGDALLQETTANHPMPAARATGFGLATGGTLAALVLGATFVVHLDAIWLVVVAALLLVASIALFSWLGATQTNRHKAWTREMVRTMPPNRFETDPDSAARFGIYTAVIWLVTFVVIAILIFTVGWWWAPLALVGGFAVMMLVLARMLFGHKTS